MKAMKENFNRRSWVEISLSKLKKNYLLYVSQFQNNTQIMAVVKADAYGHGSVVISRELQKIGVRNFAVSNIDEAIELRTSGICGQILILGYTPLDRIDKLIQYDITQTLISEQYMEDVICTGYKIKCHYAIDTGMNRIGLDADNLKLCLDSIERAAEFLDLKGVFTHLCVADTNTKECNEFTDLQIKKFYKIINNIKTIKHLEIHFMNSAAGMWHGEKEYGEYVRLGIILYGLKPSYENVLINGICPILEWKSVISMIKKVGINETIGYGRSFVVDREMTIATIPTGYADGYSRRMSNKGYVLIHGKKAKIVGKVCMDQFMVDVTNIPEVNLYDEVTLIGRSENEILTADEIGNMIDTIGYEVVCNISKRVQRIYLN